MKYFHPFIIALIVLLVVTFGIFTPKPILAQSGETPLPSPSATLQPGFVATYDLNMKPEVILNEGIPDTDEAWEVINAVERADAIDVKASHALDPSELSTAFINDPRFPLSPPDLDTVRRLSHNPALESAGWLDYKVTMINWIREQQMRPKAENAVPTDIPAPTSTVPPGVVFNPNSPPPPLIFQSLSIEGDIAKVVINEGIKTYELTLVLIDGKWYIAAYKGMGVAP